MKIHYGKIFELDILIRDLFPNYFSRYGGRATTENCTVAIIVMSLQSITGVVIQVINVVVNCNFVNNLSVVDHRIILIIVRFPLSIRDFHPLTTYFWLVVAMNRFEEMRFDAPSPIKPAVGPL